MPVLQSPCHRPLESPTGVAHTLAGQIEEPPMPLDMVRADRPHTSQNNYCRSSHDVHYHFNQPQHDTMFDLLLLCNYCHNPY